MKAKEIISIAVKILALILLVLFFVPTISVSCSKIEVEISAFDAASGNIDEKINYEFGSEAVDSDSEEYKAEPLLYLFIIFAVAILIIANKNAIASSILSLCSIILLIVFKSTINAKVEENMSYGVVKIEITPWFYVHIFICVSIIAVLMYEKFILKNSENKVMGSAGGIYGSNYNTSQGYAPQGQPQQSYNTYQGYGAPQNSASVCSTCGKHLTLGIKFCSVCGTPAPQPAPQKVEKFCSKCGTKYVEGTAFCSACGNQLN